MFSPCCTLILIFLLSALSGSAAVSLGPSHTAVHVLAPEELVTALRASFPDSRDARIQVLEFSRTPVPSGRLMFSIRDASLPPLSDPGRPFIWRGIVLTDTGETLRCWVRVRILAAHWTMRTHVSLKAGQVIRRDDLERIQSDVCPLLTPSDEDFSDYIGLSLKRSTAAQSRLSKGLVQPAPLVFRGEKVHVAAVSGLTRISFDAQAHSDGRLGQSIQLTNVHTGRSFWGVVSGQGSILVKVRLPERL